MWRGGRRPRPRGRFERIGAAALSMDDALALIAQPEERSRK
ncbi:hypothetical protein STXM2123_1317 [Streptomyces sp. F-3]|nr:hypothetical protein STXM2123_1317 [Streptomyces sp. F-3]